MNWIVLLASAVFEAIWATALGESDGGSNLTASVIFVIALIISMAGLSYSVRTIPIGTAYAIWVAIGAALTVSVAMINGSEPVSTLRVTFLVGIVAAVVLLKFKSHSESASHH